MDTQTTPLRLQTGESENTDLFMEFLMFAICERFLRPGNWHREDKRPPVAFSIGGPKRLWG